MCPCTCITHTNTPFPHKHQTAKKHTTHAPAHLQTLTTVHTNNTHTHTHTDTHTSKKEKTNTCTQSLHAHQGSWFCQGGLGFAWLGKFSLLLNSNQLPYLSDTCLVKEKKKPKTLICKTPSFPPPPLHLLGQQKTYSPAHPSHPPPSFSSPSVFLQIFTFMYANRLFPLSLFQQ